MSESKPTWIDYANLASNVAQNAQLANVHSTLAALGALQAHKALAEMNEQQAREREDQLREFVWKLEHEFDLSIQPGTMSPSAAYVTVKQIQDGMAKCGVSTASFRQFADKDRVGGFCHKLQQSVEASSSKLTEEQKNEAESYVRYQAESQELDFLMEYQQKHLRFIEATKKGDAVQAAELPKTETKKRRFAGSMVVSSVAGLVGLAVIGQQYNLSDEEFLAAGVATALVALLVSMVIGYLADQMETNAGGKNVFSKVETEDAKEAAWRADYITLLVNSREERFKYDDERKRLFENYKADDLPGLKQLKQERELFMANFKQANNL